MTGVVRGEYGVDDWWGTEEYGVDDGVQRNMEVVRLRTKN